MHGKGFRLLATSALTLCILVVATACGATTPKQTHGQAASTPAATFTPFPTATPRPAPPTPSNVPSGWTVYAGSHFTLAYPSGQWTTNSAAQGDSTAGHPDINYVLTSTDPNVVDSTGVRVEIVVNETDGVMDTDIQQACANYSHVVMLGSVPFRYSTAVVQGRDRVWVFVSNHHTVYGVQVADASASQSIQAQDDAIIATFTPEFATAGC